MNSVLLLGSGSGPRSGHERQVSEMDEFGQLQVHVAKLTSDVEYIKTDVASIKTRLDRLEDKIDTVLDRLDNKFGAVDARLHKVEKDLTEKYGSVKLWALGIYVAQAASLLFIMARGFKWL